MLSDTLATARVGAPFGLKGFLKVYPFSDDKTHLLSLKKAVLQKDGLFRELEIEECRLENRFVLMKFKGFETPESARSLAGSIITVKRSQAAPLREGEVYVSDLTGLKVVCQGQPVGRVASCAEGFQGLLLEIKTSEKESHFIPYSLRYFGKADLIEGTIELKEKMLLS